MAAARELEEDLIIADISLDGVRGGMDGHLLGTANPAITDEFLGLYR